MVHGLSLILSLVSLWLKFISVSILLFMTNGVLIKFPSKYFIFYKCLVSAWKSNSELLGIYKSKRTTGLLNAFFLHPCTDLCVMCPLTILRILLQFVIIGRSKNAIKYKQVHILILLHWFNFPFLLRIFYFWCMFWGWGSLCDYVSDFWNWN